MTILYEVARQRAEDKQLIEEAKKRAARGERYKLRTEREIMADPQNEAEKAFADSYIDEQKQQLLSRYSKPELLKILSDLRADPPIEQPHRLDSGIDPSNDPNSIFFKRPGIDL